jgi:hypothetical protein
MYKWMTALALTAAVAVAIPALSLAGGSASHHCKLNLTVRAHRVKTFSGTPPASGHDLHGGTVDGKVCGDKFRGAMREENRYPDPPGFKIKTQTYGPVGSFRSKGNGTAVVNPDGKTLTLTGQMTIGGGTGVYNGATGSIKFKAIVDDGVATFHWTGELDY